MRRIFDTLLNCTEQTADRTTNCARMWVIAIIYAVSITAFYGMGYHHALLAVEKKTEQLRQMNDVLKQIEQWDNERKNKTHI